MIHLLINAFAALKVSLSIHPLLNVFALLIDLTTQPPVNVLPVTHPQSGTAIPELVFHVKELKFGILLLTLVFVLRLFLGLMVKLAQLVPLISQSGTVKHALLALLELTTILTQKLAQSAQKDLFTVLETELAKSQLDLTRLCLLFKIIAIHNYLINFC